MTKQWLRRSMTLLVTMLLLGFLVAPASAEKEIIDKVVAIVEDEAIFKSDIDQMVKQLLLQAGQASVGDAQREQLEQRALEELINNRLVIAKATTLGIQTSFSEIERMVEKTINDNMEALGGEEPFMRQLEREGLTLNQLKQLYREQIRNRMLIDQVLGREIDRGSLQVTEDDLRQEYENRKTTLPPRPAVVQLSTIYFGFESSDNARAVAKAQIDSIYGRIAAGEEFAELAREKSQDPSAETGGSLGSVRLDDLSERSFAEAAAVLAVGEVSEPVLTGFGYHLIQVTGADSTSGEVVLRHILIKVEAGDDDIQEVFEKANGIHQRLVNGEPFDSLAIRYSDDTATAANGGDLGWLRLNELPEFFRDVLKDLKVGDLSQVLREPTGFRIVKLLGTEAERPYNFDEVREELRKLIVQEKMASSYETYLIELRKQFYVHIQG